MAYGIRNLRNFIAGDERRHYKVEDLQKKITAQEKMPKHVVVHSNKNDYGDTHIFIQNISLPKSIVEVKLEEGNFTMINKVIAEKLIVNASGKKGINHVKAQIKNCGTLDIETKSVSELFVDNIDKVTEIDCPGAKYITIKNCSDLKQIHNESAENVQELELSENPVLESSEDIIINRVESYVIPQIGDKLFFNGYRGSQQKILEALEEDIESSKTERTQIEVDVKEALADFEKQDASLVNKGIELSSAAATLKAAWKL